MTVQTISQAAEQMLQSEQQNMIKTVIPRTILDDQSIPSIPSDQLLGTASALQEVMRQQATWKSGSQRHLLQGVDGDMLEQYNSTSSCGRNEHADQTNALMTKCAQWHKIKPLRGDSQSEWPEPMASSLQGKPGLMEQTTASVVGQEAQRAQRNRQAATMPQDRMQPAVQATRRTQQTLPTRGFSWKQGFLTKKQPQQDQPTQASQPNTDKSMQKDMQRPTVLSGHSSISDLKQEPAVRPNGPQSQTPNVRDQQPHFQ